MGIFDFLKKDTSSGKNGVILTQKSVEQEMYDKNIMGYRDTRDYLDYQSKLIRHVNAAQAQYKQDKDLDKVIKALEYAFVQSNPPCNSSQNLDLADYYIKAGQNNKAWGYLNRLHSTQQAPLMHIRFMQGKILKKEKRWADAIEMYMLGYLAKATVIPFREDMFMKDIRPCIKALNWDENTVKQLMMLVTKQIDNKNFDERPLINSYRKIRSNIEQKN